MVLRLMPLVLLLQLVLAFKKTLYLFTTVRLVYRFHFKLQAIPIL